METSSYASVDDYPSDSATLGAAACSSADLPSDAWSLRHIGGEYVADQNSNEHTRKRRLPH
jgi:hypothetical protein